jgi:hypothetical protein
VPQYWRRALIRIVRYSLVRGAYLFGEIGGPVAADVAGPVDGGLDVDAGQAGQYRGGRSEAHAASAALRACRGSIPG